MRTPALEARNIERSFGHVRALDGADFDVYPGEVVALIGDNGAGKSTLVKALSGNLAINSGTILVEWTRGGPTNPWHRQGVGDRNGLSGSRLGTGSVAGPEHVPRPRDPTPGTTGQARLPRYRGDAATVAAGIRRTRGADPEPDRCGREHVGRTTPSIAIARAVAWAEVIVFLDEPTAALGVRQTEHVLEMIRRVRDRGTAVVLISHSMPIVMAVADRIQVFRLGRRVATYAAQETNMEAAGRGHDRCRRGCRPMNADQPGVAETDQPLRASRGRDLFRQVLQLQAFQILLILIVTLVVFSLLAPKQFPTWGNARQVLQNMSILGVMGIGMTFVIITAGIDLSIGSVLVFSGVIASMAMRALGTEGWGVAISEGSWPFAAALLGVFSTE